MYYNYLFLYISRAFGNTYIPLQNSLFTNVAFDICWVFVVRERPFATLHLFFLLQDCRNNRFFPLIRNTSVINYSLQKGLKLPRPETGRSHTCSCTGQQNARKCSHKTVAQKLSKYTGTAVWIYRILWPWIARSLWLIVSFSSYL